MKDSNVIIVGAGISGLICAYELEKAGLSPTIIESDDRIGGRLRTEFIENTPLDHGFQVLLTEYPAARRYLDMNSLDLREFRPGAAIFRDGKQTRFGDFLRDGSFFLPTLTSSIANPIDKLNTFVLSRQLRSKKVDDIFTHASGSTMDFLQAKGFSDKMINTFFKPFYGGIFLEKELTTPVAMFAFTFKMFSSGAAAVPAKGIAEIPISLKENLLNNTRFKFNTKVKSASSGKVILTDGTEMKCDAAIWTCPPIEAKADMDWRGCSTYYFYADTNVLNDRIIGLAPSAKYVNSFHYVTDLVAREDGKHILSATVIGKTVVPVDEVINDLEINCKITGLSHIKTCNITHALPSLDFVQYEPNVQSVRVMPGVYRTGDALSNGSLNGAMEAGRVAAEAVLSDLNGSAVNQVS